MLYICLIYIIIYVIIWYSNSIKHCVYTNKLIFYCLRIIETLFHNQWNTYIIICNIYFCKFNQIIESMKTFHPGCYSNLGVYMQWISRLQSISYTIPIITSVVV